MNGEPTFDTDMAAICGEMRNILQGGSEETRDQDRIAAGRLLFEVRVEKELRQHRREQEAEYKRMQEEHKQKLEEWKRENPLEAAKMGPFGGFGGPIPGLGF